MESKKYSAQYNESFFEKHKGGSVDSARVIVPIVLNFCAPKSVVDVGCGIGTWLTVFIENGITDVLGIDGPWVDRSRLLIPSNAFTQVDLEEQFSIDKKTDLAVCLEVGEHLSAESAKGLVKSLTDIAPVVLFSAAIPRQGGTHHVNEQWPKYWADIFKMYGYIPVDCIRKKIWDNEEVKYFYAQNTFIYVKESEALKYPNIENEIRNGNSSALPLVHPVKYLSLFRPPTPIFFRILRKIRRLATLPFKKLSNKI